MAAISLSPTLALAQRVADLPDPSADLYPVKRNENFVLDRPVTDEKLNINYNNFYEFGTSKQIARNAQALKPRPWTVKIDGMVEKPQEIAIDDLLEVPLEERLYRHRCVEGWGMVIRGRASRSPSWSNSRKPLCSADISGWRPSRPGDGAGPEAVWYPWPYIEGVTMAEARDELAFLATGTYGKPVAKQRARRCGWRCRGSTASNRSSRSPTPTSPTSGRSRYWETLIRRSTASGPTSTREVPHPRWSQASEPAIGISGRRPTLKWNGYGEFVAGTSTTGSKRAAVGLRRARRCLGLRRFRLRDGIRHHGHDDGGLGEVATSASPKPAPRLAWTGTARLVRKHTAS